MEDPFVSIMITPAKTDDEFAVQAQISAGVLSQGTMPLQILMETSLDHVFCPIAHLSTTEEKVRAMMTAVSVTFRREVERVLADRAAAANAASRESRA
jgi:hypothetical protein